MRTQWSEGGADEEGHLAGEPDRHAPSPRLADVRGTLTPQLQASAGHHAGAGRPGQGPQPHGRQHPGAGAGPGRRRGARPGRPAGPGASLVDAVNALRAAGPASWPTTTAATAACWRRPARWPLPATWAWRSTSTCWSPKATASATAAPSTATPRTGPAQVGARREELTLKALFNEELGVRAAGAHRRAQRGDAGAARARPVASTATSSARPGPHRHRGRQGRGAGLARHQGGVQRASCTTCTRSGTASAGRSASSATTRPAPTPSTRRPATADDPGLHVAPDASTRPRTWRRPS